MTYKIYLITFIITIFFVTPVFADVNYEIELAPTFKEYYKILQDNETKDELKKNSNVHIAIDILGDVIRDYPGTLTANEMITLTDVVRYWENDDVMKEKYLKMREKFLDNLDDPNTNTAEKLLFMVLIRNVEYKYMLNQTEFKKACQKRVEGLIKMKDECNNKNYRALALCCLLYVSRTYNDEILTKYNDHPIIFIGEQNAISYKYINENNENIGDLLTNIEEIKKLHEKYKEIIIPGGWKMEIETYDIIAYTYAVDLKDYENAKKYISMIEEKAPDYYRLSDLKKAVENVKIKK